MGVHAEQVLEARTPKEAFQLLSAISVPHAIEKSFISVGLHSRFHAIEGEGDDGREHARRACSDFGPVPLDQPLRALFLSSRHDRSRLEDRNMVSWMVFDFCRGHAFQQWQLGSAFRR